MTDATKTGPNDPPGSGDKTPAAIYVRMSTEHQKYSTENQADAIRAYAACHNMEIVETFSDAGKSGLNIQGRDGLKSLINCVENGEANFKAILVYDISRWGRFQDADESAYYEYICKRAGILVHYCAEQFDNDGSPVSTIVKSVKRAMAGEYSRELSAKVFAGQCRLIELGYRQGGPAGYGLRRMLIDESGKQKGTLTRGQHKSFQTDRVILVPGPEEERAIVLRIYRLFVEGGKYYSEIAKILNDERIKTDLDREWTSSTIHQILSNEKYIGNNIFNRTSCKLKKRQVNNDPSMWIRAIGVFEPIVPTSLFDASQTIIQERTHKLSDEEMLDQLSILYEKYGYLSGIIIDESGHTPLSSAYRSRFGSLLRVYQMVGFQPDRDYRYIEINRYLRKLHAIIIDYVIGKIIDLGAIAVKDCHTDIVTINDEFTASIVIARHMTTSAGSSRWKIRFDTGLRPDITIAIRMKPDNKETLDYYLLPHLDFNKPTIRLAEENGAILDTYRFYTLDYLFYLSERVPLKDIA